MPSPLPSKKANACEPCHERKVRCDAAQTGTPCSRCMSKNRVAECKLVNRRPRNSGKDRTSRASAGSSSSTSLHRPLPSDTNRRPNYPASFGSSQQGGNRALLLAGNAPSWQQPPSPHHLNGISQPAEQRSIQSAPSGRCRNGSIGSTPQPSQDDTYMQTLHRMGAGPAQTSLTPQSGGTAESHAPHVIEYFDRLSSISVLAEALGHRRERRLIQIDLPMSGEGSVKNTELAGLDEADIAYLNAKRVFDLPPKAFCLNLLQLFFEHIYPYTPIVDRNEFCERFEDGSCSRFILYAMMANAVPYASSDMIAAAQYGSREAAQVDFAHKARLLYDFGCEKQQLHLLQGSIILSSFQFSYAINKDHRMWFHNAVRIATQMGLHRQNLGEELDPATYKVCRRIWWLLYTRDVLFSLSGFSNTRCIYDDEVDVTPPTEDDWVQEETTQAAETILSPILPVHRHFFIKNCALARLGAQYLRLARTSAAQIPLPAAHTFADSMSTWRHDLPNDLLVDRVKHWNSKNVWVIILQAMSYRLECIFYRTLREHLRKLGDEDSLRWCNQQLFNSIFELDILMNRAVVHDLVQYAPSSLIVCASNLLAFQIEIALDTSTSFAEKMVAKARIHAILTYLDSTGDRWCIAKWTYRVSEWVVRKAGLMLSESTHGNAPEKSGRSQQRHPPAICEDEQMDSGGTHFDDHFQMGDDAFSFDVDHVLPDQWLQDFLGETFFGQFDEGMSTFNHV